MDFVSVMCSQLQPGNLIFFLLPFYFCKTWLGCSTGRAGMVMKGNCGPSESHCLELLGPSKNLKIKFCAINAFF